MSVRPTKWEGVYSEGPWLLTRNLVPGATVYGEGLVQSGHDEFRRWDANRSKLAAYLKCGGHSWEFFGGASRLYLGAGRGAPLRPFSATFPPGGNDGGPERRSVPLCPAHVGRC